MWDDSSQIQKMTEVNGHMADWIGDLVQAKEKELEAERIKTEKQLSDRKMVRDNLEDAWWKMKEQIEQVVNQLNQVAKKTCLVFVEENENKAILRVAGAATTAAFLAFNPKDGTLRCSFHGSPIKLIVDRHDELMWQSTASPINVWTSEQVAEQTVKTAYATYKG